MATNRQPSTVTDHTLREERIAGIAAAQHDQLTLAQLLESGLSEGAIRGRVRTGRLFRSRRGVYSLGRPPTSPEQHRMTAVLACGEGAGLSHAAAGANLAIRASAASLIDVTSPTGRGRRQEGLRVHRAKLEPWELKIVNGIPTTTCARTLLDLAEVLGEEALAKAVDRAEIEDLLDLGEIERVMRANPGRRGLLPLGACLSSLDPDSKLTRNDFELRLYALCAEAGLPKPKPNEWLHLEDRWVQPDFLWPTERIVVETDGWETHRTRQAFEADRAKDQLLTRAGYRVIRVTWRQLRDEPGLVIATIRAALAR